MFLYEYHVTIFDDSELCIYLKFRNSYFKNPLLFLRAWPLHFAAISCRFLEYQAMN